MRPVSADRSSVILNVKSSTKNEVKIISKGFKLTYLYMRKRMAVFFVTGALAFTACSAVAEEAQSGVVDGAYYVQRGTAFQVVSAPIGIMVPTLPAGAASTTINGQIYFKHQGIYYQPVIANGVTNYMTVRL